MSESSAHYQALISTFNELSERGQGKYRISMMRVQHVLVLRMEGSVNMPSAISLAEHVRPVLAEIRGQNCVIDLRFCDFMTSSAIGFLAIVTMEVTRNNGRIFLVKPSEQVSRLLRVLGVEKTMTQVETVDDALTQANVKPD